MSRLGRVERVAIVALIVLAWGLRWVALMEVPPGWRDDDLIELYTFSLRIWEEGPVLYLTGASGHEPLYHTLRAPLVALAGVNQASARVMSAGAGTLAVVLTWAVGRRMLGRLAGLVAGTAMALSYWSLMYSRFAVRHMGAVPWMVAAIYWGWRILRTPLGSRNPTVSRRRLGLMAAGLAAGTFGSLTTYYAGRVMPALLLGMALVAAPRKGRWRTYAVGLAVGLVLSVPMFWAATHMPGGDARVGEVAGPLHALNDGDIGPLLRTIWTTLGMFHATGDPEWLYNYAERAVFGPAGAVLFYGALALCLWQWRKPVCRVLPLWVAAGIGPALLSFPPSSLGHTILALPGAMLLLSSPLALLRLDATPRSWRRRALAGVLAAAIVVIPAARDLPDYFVQWPKHPMVRFLYRADYRALAETLCGDARAPRHDDIAVGSLLFGPWDRIAVRTDCPNGRPHLRWANPARALIFVNSETTSLYLQDEGDRHPAIDGLLASATAIEAPEGMQGYRLALPEFGNAPQVQDAAGSWLADQPFARALTLLAVERLPYDHAIPGSLNLMTWWRVQGDLPLPPERLMPYPPAPGVYSGPRLKVFAHLRQGETLVDTDDGLWADPSSLRPGDILLQVHTFDVGGESGDSMTLDLGLYDPKSGERWLTLSGADHVTVSVPAR